jgi:hypothetical protein
MTDKIIPGLGCLQYRLFIERYLKGSKGKEVEPCILCDNRVTCKKTTVEFHQKDGVNYP